VDGVPLSYVIHEQEAPDRLTIFTDFTDQAVACASLTGPIFDADKKMVHQILVSFTQSQTSEAWLKPLDCFKDGHRDMEALRAHFSGEGNATHNLATAEKLKETFHYRSECTLSFEIFLSRCQKMFNIFNDEGEPMSEDAKIHFLFKKIVHPQLEAAIAALRTRLITDPPGMLTYTSVANHITSCVSQLPESTAKDRGISAISSGFDGGTQ